MCVSAALVGCCAQAILSLGVSDRVNFPMPCVLRYVSVRVGESCDVGRKTDIKIEVCGRLN